MSASCLDLRMRIAAAVSAPEELDSERMDPPADQTHNTSAVGTPGSQGRPLLSGGLGMALEEELAMLTGEREGEADLTDPEAPAAGQNTDLLSLFRQKEKDLVLAAKLGKALLDRNQDLTKQYEKMNADLSEKLEHLAQEKHELCLRLERREGEWEGRVAELEADLRQLEEELERQQLQLRETQRDKSRAVGRLSDQNQRLAEQLRRAAEVERELSTHVHSLRDDFREKSVSSSQHMTQLESLQVEITMLSERKVELERRVQAVLLENELLQNTVDDLRERTLMFEKRCHEKDLQLCQSHLELQEVRLAQRQLSVRLEELLDERSLPAGRPPSSLLWEIEQRLEQEEQEEQEEEREQLRVQLWEAYCEVRSLCSHLRGSDITDSALSTDSSMDESSSEASSSRDVPVGGLRAGLLELRRLTQNLMDGNESTGSRRSDEEALEEQVRKMGEELREIRDLYDTERDKKTSGEEEILRLHSEMAVLSLEMSSVQEESVSEVHETSDQLQSAIRDRDDAIAKKKTVEMELAKCKIDIMSLNSQLLDAIQQKINLSQQLEAWQDDMHRVIGQQLMEKHQGEWLDAPLASRSTARPPSSSSSSRSTRCGSEEDKGLFSFFKKN